MTPLTEYFRPINLSFNKLFPLQSAVFLHGNENTVMANISAINRMEHGRCGCENNKKLKLLY